MKDTLVARIWFSGSTRRRVWRKLAAMLRHGVTLQRAVTIMLERLEIRKSPLAQVFASILLRLNGGQPLDVAVRDFASQEEIMLLRGGHQSGHLGESLKIRRVSSMWAVFLQSCCKSRDLPFPWVRFNNKWVQAWEDSDVYFLFSICLQ